MSYDIAYCGALPVQPPEETSTTTTITATTRTTTRVCECEGCNPLNTSDVKGKRTAGPCKYNGPKYNNVCSDYNKNTKECHVIPGDDETTIEDCCKQFRTTTTTTTATTKTQTDEQHVCAV